MTRKLCQYFIFILVCFIVNSVSAQTNVQDSIRKDSVVIHHNKPLVTDTSKSIAGKTDTTLPQKSCLDRVKLKTLVVYNKFADVVGVNIVSNSVKNLFEIPHVDLAGDTIKKFKHSPSKASYLSAVIPGAGQIYNRKYWKVPIIYVGLGVVVYLGINYYHKFNQFKDTYMFRSGYDSTKTDYYPYITSTDILYQNWNYNRRNFELTCIFGSLLYVLNIIDASVDAHLFKFDISDDLSMRIEPNISYYNSLSYNRPPSPGIKLTFGF